MQERGEIYVARFYLWLPVHSQETTITIVWSCQQKFPQNQVTFSESQWSDSIIPPGLVPVRPEDMHDFQSRISEGGTVQYDQLIYTSSSSGSLFS
jgi:hypothetical protein